MGIGIKELLNGLRMRTAGRRMIRLCVLALISGMFFGSPGNMVCAVEPEGTDESAAEEDISVILPGEEETGDYAMQTEPEGDPDDWLKLTAEAGEHVVKKGESLWKIAQRVYGNGSRWKDISVLNGLDDPGRIFPSQCLALPDREYYIQKPWIQRRKGYYLEDAGAFRFQTPECWAMGTCSLDVCLSTFSSADRPGRVLWGIKDNEMGEDAWAESWEDVCADMTQTARTVFGEDLTELSFEKYQVESGNEVYAMRCIFTDENGRRRIVSAAYRFGEKNLMEFIGLAPEDFSPDIGRLTLYTAATYEEYEEERHMGFGEENGEYRGMEVWEYPSLHNPFVLAWEYTNGSAWHLKRKPETIEDYVIDWKEPVLPAVLKEALQLENPVRYSDLLQVETLEVVESAGYDFCSINGVLYETDWEAGGDALVEDISNFGGLYALRIQIGDITEVSPLEKLTVLEELEILTGSQAQEIRIPPKLHSLKKCVLERAPLQEYVDSLDDSLWERTCREQKIVTFQKTETDT